MLVLSRREKESIVIDGRIRLTVVAIQGNKIRLGIEARRTCRSSVRSCSSRRQSRSWSARSSCRGLLKPWRWLTDRSEIYRSCGSVSELGRSRLVVLSVLFVESRIIS